jgi:hypothetical protein
LPNGDNIRTGVLRCRDLVELYYGARIATDLIENDPSFTAGQTFILLPLNPARIRYELIFENSTGLRTVFALGSPRAFGVGNQQFYTVSPDSTLIIVRNWTTDADAVVAEVDCNITDGNLLVTTRETILTPLPVDESP